jgi:phage terminase Nu1 subunit (DNA packaging protein)
MPSTATQQPERRRLHTKNQTARHYGVTTRTIDNWIKRGMPYRPCGGAKRFDLDDVDAWLERDEQERLRGRHDNDPAA